MKRRKSRCEANEQKKKGWCRLFIYYLSIYWPHHEQHKHFRFGFSVREEDKGAIGALWQEGARMVRKGRENKSRRVVEKERSVEKENGKNDGEEGWEEVGRRRMGRRDEKE